MNCLILLFSFISKLSQLITAFVNQFGIITDVQLAQLNKSISIQIVDTDTAIHDQDDQDDENGVKEELELGDTPDNMRKLSLMIRDMSKYTILISLAAVSSFLMCILVIIGSVIDTSINDCCKFYNY